MKKYFLDFGTQHGDGLEKIRKLEDFDEDTEIHSFEANPLTFQGIPFKDGVNYYNVGVSSKTGFHHFNCEEESEGKFTGGGSSLLDLSHWNTEKVYNWEEGERFSKNKEAQVFCLSIIDILNMLLPDKTEESIIAKFDIEGAEYPIFDLLEDTDNFKWFSKIYVEFHDHCLVNSLVKDCRYWLSCFQSKGIETVIWD